MAQTQRIGTVATHIGQENGTTYVQYHRTKVVQFNDKTIILNSNDYATATTKTRMNQAANQFGLGYHVFQKDFDWFVDFKGETLGYEDHMVLNR